MRNTGTYLKAWLPVLLWMALIFSASADARSSEHSSGIFEPFVHWLFPQLSQLQVEGIHYLFRKCAHLTEFAVLGILAWRALRITNPPPKRTWSWAIAGLALTIVTLYAGSDEIHQMFVPTRTAKPSDVLVDTIGGASGLLLLWASGKIFKRW